MSSRFARARVSSVACRWLADARCGTREMRNSQRLWFCILHVACCIVLLPAPAAAQRDPFFSAVVTFYRSSAGLYGDEGPQLTTQLAAMSTALERWDGEIRDADRELRSRLKSADDAQTKLQIHTLLASRYLERGRLNEAVREFDEDIEIDPRRAAFHRLKGLVLQAMSRPAEAAEAFRAGRSPQCVSIDRPEILADHTRGSRTGAWHAGGPRTRADSSPAPGNIRAVSEPRRHH
jgi:Bacterial transcriptional activator domain